MEETSLAAGIAQQSGKPIHHQYAHALFQRLFAGLQLTLPFRSVLLSYVSQDGSTQQVHFGNVETIADAHASWLKRTDWQQGQAAELLDDRLTRFELLSQTETTLTLVFSKPALFRWTLFSLELSRPVQQSHIDLVCLSAPLAWDEIDRLVLESPCEQEAPVGLTKREGQVLEWLCKGKSTWEISHILDIKERTVKYHVGRILEKYGVDNRVQLLVKLLGGARQLVA